MVQIEKHVPKAISTAPPTFAAVGDSITDEYRSFAPDRSQARNWVEIMAASRRGGFGRYSRSSLGEPRLDGYTTNWARSDATTTDLVRNQLPGLAAQIKRGGVKYVSVIAGDNDFGFFLLSVPSTPPAAILPNLIRTEKTAEANFDTTVRTLLAASPKVRLAAGTIFDLRQEPSIERQVAPFGAQGKAVLDATAAEIAVYNDHIRAIAAGNDRIALVDLAAQTSSPSQFPDGKLHIGGTTIDLTTTGDDYHHFLLADGVHPGTVAQGLIANVIIDSVDAKFNAGIPPLTAQEILNLARDVQKVP